MPTEDKKKESRRKANHKYSRSIKGREARKRQGRKTRASEKWQQYYRNYSSKYAKTEAGKLSCKKSYYKRIYGIDYTIIPEFCQVCGSSGKVLVDHCHETGKVRGFLCSGCNLALGHVGDSRDVLLKLAEYVK